MCLLLFCNIVFGNTYFIIGLYLLPLQLLNPSIHRHVSQWRNKMNKGGHLLPSAKLRSECYKVSNVMGW